ncbi:Metallo-dependent phosphatase-like protein [Trametes meyenii]|nr:Metallo-dependent phosphatase-like protein [Trametes meyenii]
MAQRTHASLRLATVMHRVVALRRGLRRSSLQFMDRRTYAQLQPCKSPCSDSEPLITVVCISDTHNTHDHLAPLPPGDILIHAGDFTNSGTEEETHAALRYLSSAPHPHKVFIAGNHDIALAHVQKRDAILAAYPNLIYLEHTTATLRVRGRDLNIFGSPYSLKGANPGPFQYTPDEGESRWSNIPPSIDILVTHSPPQSHLDGAGWKGCPHLCARLWGVRPRLHVFGHIHKGQGLERVPWTHQQRKYERAVAEEVEKPPGEGEGSKITPWVGEAVPFNPAVDTFLVNAAAVGGAGQGPVVVELNLAKKRAPIPKKYQILR